MDEEKQNEKPASTTPELPQVKQGPPESRLNHFLLSLLRWALGILIIAGLGALLVIFTIYRSKQQELVQSQGQLQQANVRIADLESKVENLSTFEGQNQDLQAELEKAQLHVAILSARSDIAAAQLALARNDQAKARLAVSKTPETLKMLENMLDPGKKKLATDMQSRLELAVKGIGENAYAAASDFDVLATALLELENAFFAKP